MKHDFLLTNEAARLIGVSPATIRAWEKSGKLPAIKTDGGVRLFERDDCERFKQKRA